MGALMGGRGDQGEEERQANMEWQSSGSLNRSDLGKLGCHYRVALIYTYPSAGKRDTETERERGRERERERAVGEGQ